MSRILDIGQQREPSTASDPIEPMPLGLDLEARVAAIDEKQMCEERMERLRTEPSKRNYAAALFFDPLNIRNAMGTRNMAVWTLHAPRRYAFVATDGPVVLLPGAPTLPGWDSHPLRKRSEQQA
jgi:hypothetical protein